MRKRSRFERLLILLGMTTIVAHSLLSEQKMEDSEVSNFKRHAIKTIESEDGDIIDCIDIYQQPAFDHPALRNHTIQMTPSYDPNMLEATLMRSMDTAKTRASKTSQIWQKSGSCPKGTIPIRRNQNKVLQYASKKPSYHVKQPNARKIAFLQQTNRSKAILLTYGYSYSGVKGDIKVWNPHVESDDEYSISQVSLHNGPYYDFESVESGWAVNPSVYGDRKTRLFVYWTADASKKTGCFDLTCPGFVQTSSEIALGAAIYPISVFGGLPYQITLYIFKDPVTSNLWVQYGEKINIGYWPPDLFTALRYNAESAEWGGEVYSSKLEQSPHTSTAMGSGNFPDFVFGNSGYVKRMRVLDNALNLRFPDWVENYVDEFRCYDAIYLGDYIEDPEFYYGGPGRNPMCP